MKGYDIIKEQKTGSCDQNTGCSGVHGAQYTWWENPDQVTQGWDKNLVVILRALNFLVIVSPTLWSALRMKETFSYLYSGKINLAPLCKHIRGFLVASVVILLWIPILYWREVLKAQKNTVWMLGSFNKTAILLLSSL